jgi:tRNA(Ile)-lysidine synthase
MPRGSAAGATKAGAGFSPALLARRLTALVGPLRGARFCVAYSGGADSTALLAAMATLRGRHRLHLRALHVDHRWQPAARAMARQARAAARGLEVPCRVVTAPVRMARGESPEAAARAVRYAALRAHLRPGEWLLLAQHQDDQAEALLLQLLRGAGISGLAAMPPRAGVLLRPLLEVPRAALVDYLRRRRLPWIEDPSNADQRLARNYLRRRVLPVLRERWPGLAAALGRSAALAAEARGLLAERAESQLREAQVGPALAVSALRRLAPPDRHNLLRYWIEQRGLPLPDQRRLLELAGPVLRARADAQPQVRWPGVLVRRHGGLLHAAPDSPMTAARATGGRTGARWSWDWLTTPRLELPGGDVLELRPDARGPLARSALPPRVHVAFRAADGTVAGRTGGRTLKRQLRAAAREPWRREAVPLLYTGRTLLAIGDSWHAPRLTKAARGLRIDRCRLHWRRSFEDPGLIC